MEKAAENPGGSASDGIGMGMGFAMANQLTQSMAGGQQAASSGPPPLPNPAVYHVGIDGQAAGPFTRSRLSELAANGTLTAESLVWKQGMQSWQKAGELHELSALFASQPPPLPPQ